MDEGLVAVEEPVPAGEQVALEPALALVLGEHLDDPAGRSEAFVGRLDRRVPLLVRHAQHIAEPVGRRLVRAEDAEVFRIRANDVGEP